ncbi:MAG: hypothetical protein ACREAR_07905 [Nitrosotalea sp.]
MSTEDELLKEPFLYLGEALEEFKEEVARGILHEMLEERGKKILEIGLGGMRDEIEYEITEDIRKHLKTKKERYEP